jgi:hypothetical protein
MKRGHYEPRHHRHDFPLDSHSSVAFRYSGTFMIRLRILTTTASVSGRSFFLYCSFRDCGCGKAMSDDFFRRDRPSKALRQLRFA